ncbi:MAG TPA: FKBP-type peptidyl-prolyl cis-trans isomerase [Luteitalea sp.]|nr:FKBP-type peptidyl-prolyl cis-trans isomerase [Luteitalea sp.]
MRILRPASIALAVIVVVACAPRAVLQPVVTASGLSYTIVQKGVGDSARPGQYVSIRETTALPDGSVHFTTDGRAPVRFLLGGKQVIDGLDEGVTCMKVGERRRMVIPPALSKRSNYPVGLDPNATLYYEVTVVKIEDAPQPPR